MSKSTPRLLQVLEKAVPLHRVFHGIRFKVNERLVVVRQPSFFYLILSLLAIPLRTLVARSQ